MTCEPGCDDCCQKHLSVFAVEAEGLGLVVDALPREGRERLSSLMERWDERHGGRSGEGPCPLLDRGRCALYEARPVLCRTHGFPLLSRPSGDPDGGETGSLSWCFRNFRDAPGSPIPPEGILDMDRVNRVLAAIQGLADAGRTGRGVRRIPIREALRAALEKAR
jgi:hypothetical protein